METETHDEPLTIAKPGREHEWLQGLVGEWESEAEMTVGEGEQVTVRGTETVRSLEGLWIVAEGRGGMPGDGEATTMMTLGYDPRKQRYVGSWIGSMMDHLWVYEGQLDADGKVLSLDCEGPSMTAHGQMAKYRDVIELKSDDHRILRGHTLGEDGQWQQLTETHYRRKR